ncbi:MAG: hypothetical protein C0614_03420 [Desulfuromonas sp.]|nr:MAG: hypothetical protein C0614_03420 [Desulfuromonas sp.]
MTALFAALIMVPFLRQWAIDQGTVDLPDARKVHSIPMPRLGGIAIFLAFLFSCVIFLPIDDRIRGMLAGTLVIFATGVVDDLHGLNSRGKFAGQIGACLITILVGKIYLTELGDLFGFGPLHLPVWAAVPFTVFAVVGVINAINLIDGLDGLAGGVSSIALVAFFLIAWLEGDPEAMVLSAAMAGAIFGFLKDNFYPARIFMGDTGAMVVGYVLAFLAVFMTQRPTAAISPMVPVVVLGLPLLDTVWVMMRRLLRGGSPFTADRTHVHHKFLDLGFDHRPTVIIIYGISLFWAVCALLLRGLAEYQLLVFYLVTAVSCYLALRLLLTRHTAMVTNPSNRFDLRSSRFYGYLYERSHLLMVGIKFLLGLYMGVALYAIFTHSLFPWQIALALLGGGCYLSLMRSGDDRQFLLLIVYAAFGVAATQVWVSQETFFGSLTVKRCGDLLLGAAGILVMAKLLLRRSEEFVLSTADYLVLAVCIFLAVASQKELLGYSINGPLFRTVLGVLAVRTLVSDNFQTQRVVISLAFVVLVLSTLVGLFSV